MRFPSPFVLLSCAVIGAAFPATLAVSPALPLVQPRALTTAAAESVGAPVRLSIPRIGVETSIEAVGLTPDGKLDVPVDPVHSGWYRGGPKPGEEGNAVLDGHYTFRGPGVFHRLNELEPGDDILVTGDDGVTRTFRVREAETYHVSTAPLAKIFGDADGKRLTVITCAGTWDDAIGHYDARHVVFAELAEDPPEETAAIERPVPRPRAATLCSEETPRPRTLRDERRAKMCERLHARLAHAPENGDLYRHSARISAMIARPAK